MNFPIKRTMKKIIRSYNKFMWINSVSALTLIAIAYFCKAYVLAIFIAFVCVYISFLKADETIEKLKKILK